jgi:hypothetical protein
VQAIEPDGAVEAVRRQVQLGQEVVQALLVF